MNNSDGIGSLALIPSGTELQKKEEGETFFTIIREYFEKAFYGYEEIAFLILYTLLGSRLGMPVRLHVLSSNRLIKQRFRELCKLVPSGMYMTFAEAIKSRKMQRSENNVDKTIVIENVCSMSRSERQQMEKWVSSESCGWLIFDDSAEFIERSAESFLQLQVDDDSIRMDNILVNPEEVKLKIGFIQNNLKRIYTLPVTIPDQFMEQIYHPLLAAGLNGLVDNLLNLLRIQVLMNYFSRNQRSLNIAVQTNTDLTSIMQMARQYPQSVAAEEKDYQDYLMLVDNRFLEGENSLPELCVRIYRVVESLNQINIRGYGFFDADEDPTSMRKLLKMPDHLKAWATEEEIFQSLKSEFRQISNNTFHQHLRMLVNQKYLRIQKKPGDTREDIYAVSSASPKSTLNLGNSIQ